LSRFEDKPQRAKKPSLLPSSTPAAGASGKIFASLEQGDKIKPIFKHRSGWIRSKWMMGLLGMVGVVGVGAAIVAYQNATPPQQVIDTADQGVSARKGAIATPVLVASAPEPEPQGLAALIVNDPVVKSSPVIGLTANPLVAGVPAPTLAMAPDPQGDTRKPLRTESVATRKNTPVLPASVARRAESSVNNRPATDSTRQATKPMPKAVPARPQTANDDKDVALLAALVAHGAALPVQRNVPQATRRDTQQQSARATENTSKSAKNNIQSASAATAMKTRERNRDIVERSPTDTTDTLLQRCKQLGLIEGEFCRWRICSGRWDSDAACKIPQATSF